MANRDKQRKRTASGGQKRVGFSAGEGIMKRSRSDSKLYREEALPSANDGFGGSTSSLRGTYDVITSALSGNIDPPSSSVDGVVDLMGKSIHIM